MFPYILALGAIIVLAVFGATTLFYDETVRQWVVDNPTALYMAACVILALGAIWIATRVQAYYAAVDARAKQMHLSMAISGFGLLLLAMVVAATPQLLA